MPSVSWLDVEWRYDSCSFVRVVRIGMNLRHVPFCIREGDRASIAESFEETARVCAWLLGGSDGACAGRTPNPTFRANRSHTDAMNLPPADSVARKSS